MGCGSRLAFVPFIWVSFLDSEIGIMFVAIYQLAIEMDSKTSSVQFGIRSLGSEGGCISLATSWIRILLTRLTTRTTHGTTLLTY